MPWQFDRLSFVLGLALGLAAAALAARLLAGRGARLRRPSWLDVGLLVVCIAIGAYVVAEWRDAAFRARLFDMLGL
jgi:hypothetical protein